MFWNPLDRRARGRVVCPTLVDEFDSIVDTLTTGSQSGPFEVLEQLLLVTDEFIVLVGGEEWTVKIFPTGFSDLLEDRIDKESLI